ncbi:MAG: response regulator [Candidatus Limivivens sp.]|nr:response regulator [Candidatus Limivivens sp.]
MKKLVVIDDEYLLVTGIARMIEKEKLQYEVVGSANDGVSGLSLIREKQPQLAVVDIRMPGMNGLDLIETAKAEFPDMVFVIISGYKEFEYARRGLELGVCAYIDKPVTIQKLKNALASADELLDKKEEDRSAQQQQNTKKKLLMVQDEIMEMINEKSTKGGMERVDAWLELLRECTSDLERFRNDCFQFLCAAVGAFYDQWRKYEKNLAFPSYQNVVNLKTYEEVESYTRLIFERIFEKVSVRSLGSSHRIILQILDYINENYRQDIGLNELADMVKMNAAYLSILFKDEVGTTYVKYLTSVRIDHAKELLLEGYKVSEVSSMVGYSNYRYFCDIFKREVGQTPNEYRGNVRKK